VTRCFGSDHDDVDVGARLYLPVVNVEAVSKRQGCAGLEVGFDLGTIDFGDVFIGQKNHNQVGGLNRVGNFSNFQAGVFGFRPRGTAFAQTDNDVHPGLVQVECVGVALRTITNNGDLFALNQREVTIFVVKNFHL
jgi:hypothetical protein